MQHALPPPPALATLTRPALFLDFDGTLVEIADGPDAIRVPGDLGARLLDLAARVDGRLAVVTGRAPDDVRGHIGALELFLAGSHGAAITAPDGSDLGHTAQGISDRAKAALSAYAESEGLLYEDKAHGAGLHYRAAPDKKDAAIAHVRDLADAHGLAIKTGKQVIEIVRPGADKGCAVRTLMEERAFAGATPIFIGDDVTDEDGFVACAELGGFGVLVGEPRETAARHRLAGVADVHAWLLL